MTQEFRSDLLTPALAARFAAALDRDPIVDIAPQGIHWCVNTPEPGTAALGPDGHADTGTILPATHLPRRMWASSDLRFLVPIAVGARVDRVSQLLDVTEKSGSSGALTFVRLRHDTSADGTLAIEETQTIVYREAPRPDAPPPPAPRVAEEQDWTWERALVPTPPLLFRYSALTFNTHRIHYDQAYVTGVEGYPGLVVHGPLMATLLLDLADRELGRNRLTGFTFRAVAPAFADAPLRLLAKVDGNTIDLRVRSSAGHDHVIATASF